MEEWTRDTARLVEALERVGAEALNALFPLLHPCPSPFRAGSDAGIAFSGLLFSLHDFGMSSGHVVGTGRAVARA